MRREINYDVGIFWDCLLVAKEAKIIVIIDQPDFWSRYVKKLTQQKHSGFGPIALTLYYKSCLKHSFMLKSEPTDTEHLCKYTTTPCPQNDDQSNLENVRLSWP